MVAISSIGYNVQSSRSKHFDIHKDFIKRLIGLPGDTIHAYTLANNIDEV
ncbi:MAG TPA: hypothetical protein VK140_03870 [Ktedonobacteraceae bacterium]|nr:hypothetical protein [Ktedonobacteraceae bacterium]